MFRKIASSTLLSTIISLPLTYVLIQQLQASSLTSLILSITGLVFIFSGFSAWLSLRTVNPRPAQKHAKPEASSRREAAPKAANPQGAASGAKREAGQVKWFNASKGFGFITRDSGEDIFVHFRSIRGEGHRVLKDGQRVEFSVSVGDKGLQADDVMAVSR
jgi:CspA family cold shock protein